MMIKTLVVSAVAGVALATTDSLYERAGHIEVLKARQLSSINANPTATSACNIPDNILSIVTSLPTPPLVIAPLLASITDRCNIPKVTGTYASVYNSYTSELLSFFSAYSAPLVSWGSSYSQNCPGASALDLGACTTSATSVRTTASGSPTAVTTGSSTRTGSSNTATSDNIVVATGAAYDNAGVSFGAAAVVGVFGAIAML